MPDPMEPFLSDRRARLAALDDAADRDRRRLATRDVWRREWPAIRNVAIVWLALFLILLFASWWPR